MRILDPIDFTNGILLRPLRFGLPKGNLNKPEENRGYTKLLFELAGYHIEGYEPGKEEPMPRVKELEGLVEFYCMKPKQFPSLLESGIIDVAILGQDTLEEWSSKILQTQDWNQGRDKIEDEEGKEREWLYANEFSMNKMLEGGQLHQQGVYNLNERVKLWMQYREEHIQHPHRNYLDLKYGSVDVLWAVTEGYYERIAKRFNDVLALYNFVGQRKKKIKTPLLLSVEPRLEISSAYPNLTFASLCKFINQNLISAFGHGDAFTGSKDKTIFIYNLPSNTELMTRLGCDDYIVDCVASGKSLKDNGLIVIGEPIIKNSTARLCFGLNDYFNPAGYHLKNEEEQRRITEIKERLMAASIEYGKTRRDSIYYRERE